MLEIIGRGEELETVASFLASPEALPGGIVLEGEPGIGKTTIWRWAVDSAREKSIRVLATAPAASEAELSFAGLVSVLQPVVDEVLPGLAEPRRRALSIALLLEEPRGRRPDRLAIGLAVHDALRQLSLNGPVLVAIDDVQWLDAPSAAVLEFALRRSVSAPVGVLLAARRDGASKIPLGSALPADRVTFLRLGPLSLGALHYLLLQRLGSTFPRPIIRRLHELSAGNPFYALELAKAKQRGWITLERGEELPEDIAGLVAHRLAELPSDTLAALAASAALSRPTPDLLKSAGVADPLRTLRPAEEAGVVRLDDVIRFEHPLLASAAYRRLSMTERRELHRRLAAVVDDVEERARHLSLAADAPVEDVAHAVEVAAQLAFRRGATSVAAELASRARQLTPDASRADANRRALMEAEYRFESGDVGAAVEVIERLVAATPKGPPRARLLSRLARYLHFGEDVGRGVEVLREALIEAEDDAATRAEIEEGLAWGLLLMRRDVPAAAQHARSAAAYAEREGDEIAIAEALAIQALTGLAIGERSTWPVMERALSLEPALLPLRVLRHPSFAYAYWLMVVDDLDSARETILVLERRAIEQGDDSALPALYNHRALVDALAGRWPEALREAREAHALALQDGQRPSEAASLSRIALVLAWQGSSQDARDAAEEAIATATGDREARAVPLAVLARGGEVAVWALGSLHLALGSPREALHYFDPLADVLIGAGIRELGEMRWLPEMIEALIAVGETSRAEPLAAIIENAARSNGRPSVRAAAARMRGLLLAASGASDEAVEQLRAGALASALAPLPLEHGRTLLLLGETYRRVKQKRLARDTLLEASSIFERLGARLWLDRARRELARLGGRAPAAQLTVTEQRVVELVAQGLSNRELAASLYVTPKTVETTLSRIYAKLGVHSRTALVRRALEETPTGTNKL